MQKATVDKREKERCLGSEGKGKGGTTRIQK
jgi:hypothetical protein